MRIGRGAGQFAKTLMVLAVLIAGCRGGSELPLLYPLPQVELISERGVKTQLSSLQGRVAVYDFIFTRCPGTCPMLTQQMRKLTKKFPADSPVNFVSLSVDPAHDTPSVLAQYAAQHRNDSRWLFYTGEHDAIRTLSVKGFKLAAMDGGSAKEPIVHSTKFVVVDKNGTIRGYYDAMDDAALEQLVRDARDLTKE